jgi:hypothetical protein
MPAEQRVEYAIDVITEYCMRVPAERDAIRRRILGPLDLELAALKERAEAKSPSRKPSKPTKAATPEPEPASKPKPRKAKTAKAEAEPAPDASGLTWNAALTASIPNTRPTSAEERSTSARYTT